MHKRIVLTLGCLVLSAACAGAHSPGATPAPRITSSTSATPVSATPSPSTPPRPAADVTLAYFRPGLGIVGISPDCCGNQGVAPSRLWLTTDMLHWRDVTPPGSAHGNFAGDHPIFEQASFLDANTGWVTAWDIGDVRVTLYRTSDGGSHWTHAPSGGHSANAGAAERFQLLDARTAYRLSLEPTGPGVNLAVTKDAGEHWATVYDGRTGHGQGPGVEPMTFASEERGFATDVLTLADYSYEATGQLSTTIDGGHTWSTSHPPLAGSRPCSQGVPPTCVLASPTFFDQADGVLPGATREGTKTTISFDQTANAGSTWTLAGHLTVPDPRAPGSQRCGATCALASIAGAADWWVISRSAGRLRTWRTTDAGSTWSRTSAVAVHGRPTSLWAVSATVAWAVVETSVPQGTTRELMVTRDGGVTWHVVRPLRPGD